MEIADSLWHGSSEPVACDRAAVPIKLVQPCPSSDRAFRAVAPGSARTRSSGINDDDCFDLDHEIGSGQTGDADGRAGRGCHAEIAHADVGALLELVEVGGKGVGLDDVRPGSA